MAVGFYMCKQQAIWHDTLQYPETREQNLLSVVGVPVDVAAAEFAQYNRKYKRKVNLDSTNRPLTVNFSVKSTQFVRPTTSRTICTLNPLIATVSHDV